MRELTDPSAQAARHRGAMSLVELLVVLAAIGILIAMLLPAIQSVRERARRATCQNHVRQVAVGVLVYADTRRGALPSMWRSDRMKPWENFSWRAEILAELEQSALAEQLDVSQPPLANRNLPAVRVIIPVFQCPSTPGSPRRISDMGNAELHYDNVQAAACDYAAVFEVAQEGSLDPLAGAWQGPPAMDDDRPPPSDVTPDPTGPTRRARRGHLRSIADGLSKTILLVEQAGKPLRFDASRAAQHVTPTEGPWATAETATFYAPGVNRDNLSGPYGFHVGANVAMCDGSVLMLSAATEWEVLAALLTRDGDEIIEAADWR